MSEWRDRDGQQRRAAHDQNSRANSRRISPSPSLSRLDRREKNKQRAAALQGGDLLLVLLLLLLPIIALKVVVVVTDVVSPQLSKSNH